MFDFHVHTHFSDDCSIEMESYIAPALEKGLKGICITDHVDIDYPCLDVKFQMDHAKYMSEINRLKDKYQGKLEILAGVEFGMQPHILDADISFFQDKSFDYVLGSMHTANKKDLYSESYIGDEAERQLIQEYFEDMLYCAKNFKSFNNLGHLDAIARYVTKGSFTASEHFDYIEEILKTLIHSGKGIEVNTSGKRYNLPHFHPEPSIIKLYKQLGGEIITMGSDSHNPKTLAYGFSEAIAMLQACGFKYNTIFRKCKPEFIKL